MFVRTDRLLLRPGWIEDAAALAAAIGEERIVRNLARAPWPYALADARAFLVQPTAALPSFLILARTAGRPRLIGGIGFARTPDDKVELGYWIAAADWNRGYVTEAGHAMFDLARESLRLCRIVAGHFVDNPASGRVLEKLGFTAAGERDLRYSAARGENAAFQGFAIDLCAKGCVHDETERMAA